MTANRGDFASLKSFFILKHFPHPMPVLKGISSVMTPELLKTLAEMGHSDQIGFRSRLPVTPSDRRRELPRCVDCVPLPWWLDSLGRFRFSASLME